MVFVKEGIMDLELKACELSMIIEENEELQHYKIIEIAEDYIQKHWDFLMENHKGYILDRAMDIYCNV
jgi:hypothetical protein